MCIRGALLVALSLAPACESSSGTAATAPAAPSENDPAYEISRVGGWYLIGDELSAGDNELEIQVLPPSGVKSIDLWLDGGAGQRLARAGDGFGARLDISTLAAGEHEIILAEGSEAVAFARVTFQRSHPLYVVVSTDWDDPDNTDASLRLQEDLHERHPHLKVTHFVGPYTFTDQNMTLDRKELQASWVRGMRDDYGDEIGLHIHPYCSFVESAGMTCKTEPSTVYFNGDDTGYTVLCNAYSEEEFETLLHHADDIFEENGLGKPTSFRAGGWTADLSTLRALEAAGYVADTSANNWSRMEEWEGQANGVLYEWNKENWSSITDTSQPYYPSTSDVLASGDENLGILEVPDNGILVDYVTGEEMIEVLDANWDGGPLDAPINISIGWHPSSLQPEYQQRMHVILSHLDEHLAVEHNGPIIYETLSNMPLVWTH